MKKDYSKHPFVLFFSYFKPHRTLFAIDMFCAIAVAAIDLIFPFVSKKSMELYLPNHLFKTFFIVMGIIIAAYVLRSVFYYIITVFGHKMGVLVEADMREEVFSHMQELSFSFYDNNRTGVLMSRITTDLFDITELAHHGPENVVISVLTLAGSLSVLMTVNWKLALVLAIVIPIFIFFTQRQRTNMLKANLEVKKKTAEINASIESSISGIRTAKAFVNESTEESKFKKSNDMFKTAKADYYKAMGVFHGGMEFTMGIMQVIVITFGGYLIMRGEMNYIDLLTFTLYVSTFLSAVRTLATFMEMFMQGSAGFSRFLEIMRTEPDIKDAPDAVDAGVLRGDIVYNNVSFNYDDGTCVLKNINLSIKAGESFALVGPSGGGKTTMCHLLPRFYDVTAGAITIDGTDIRKYTQDSLRRNIGIIQQDVFIFAGTIRENIRYGRPDATDEEVARAAVLAEIHKEIMEMPDGYDTYVGERGIMLSGGQKQRLSIARVFLKNPPILILDEATSALDSVTEQKIQSSLEALSEGRTSIIIAHRLSTIRNADRIAVIDDERIVESGSHEELMAKGGRYADLQAAQGLRNAQSLHNEESLQNMQNDCGEQ